MTLRTQGETFQSVIGHNKTNVLLKNSYDPLLEAVVNVSGDRVLSEKQL